MFGDEDTRKFLLLLFVLGIVLVLMGCFLQNMVLPTGQNPLMEILLGRNRELPTSGRPEYEVDPEIEYTLRVQTNMGEFFVKLFPDVAPDTVENFLGLVSIGHYEDTEIYRLIQDFIFQGGSSTTKNSDPDDDPFGNPGYVIKDEINWDALALSQDRREELESLGYESVEGLDSKRLVRYSIAMANAGIPNTGGSQFFIVVTNDHDPRLEDMQGKYTVFGRVIRGFDTIRTINNLSVVENGNNQNYPSEEVVIEEIEIWKNGEPPVV